MKRTNTFCQYNIYEIRQPKQDKTKIYNAKVHKLVLKATTRKHLKLISTSSTKYMSYFKIAIST